MVSMGRGLVSIGTDRNTSIDALSWWLYSFKPTSSPHHGPLLCKIYCKALRTQPKDQAAAYLFVPMKHLLWFLVFIALTPQSHVMAQDRKYGPLRLDLRNVRKNDFAFIVPAKNKQDQTLFLGIYCEERLFNFRKH